MKEDNELDLPDKVIIRNEFNKFAEPLKDDHGIVLGIPYRLITLFYFNHFFMSFFIYLYYYCFQKFMKF